MRLVVHTSELEPRRLLKGTPSGEASLTYRSPRWRRRAARACVVERRRLAHEQERRGPARAVGAVVLAEPPHLAVVADAALHRHAGRRALADERHPVLLVVLPDGGLAAWPRARRGERWISARIGPSSSPSVAKRWPPQLSPDSMRSSSTSIPFFARNFPCTSAERKSDTLRMIPLAMRPLGVAVESGEALEQPEERGVHPGREDQADARRDAANPRSAAFASDVIGAERMRRRGRARARSSFVMMLTSAEPGTIAARERDLGRRSRSRPSGIARKASYARAAATRQGAARSTSSCRCRGERQRSERGHLPVDEVVDQVEPRGDAAGARVVSERCDGVVGQSRPPSRSAVADVRSVRHRRGT